MVKKVATKDKIDRSKFIADTLTLKVTINAIAEVVSPDNLQSVTENKKHFKIVLR